MERGHRGRKGKGLAGGGTELDSLVLVLPAGLHNGPFLLPPSSFLFPPPSPPRSPCREVDEETKKHYQALADEATHRYREVMADYRKDHEEEAGASPAKGGAGGAAEEKLSGKKRAAESSVPAAAAAAPVADKKKRTVRERERQGGRWMRGRNALLACVCTPCVSLWSPHPLSLAPFL